MKQKRKNENTLWTRDFTIITIGSLVSMLGNDASGFVMSLMVLDYTGSTLYYAIYMAVYMLPSVVMPILSGPFLDRFSRKRTIYTLDFVSAGIYTILAVILATGGFSFPILTAATFLMGCIDSVYQVAYDSFYPLLVTKGHYTKAYSIASTLETLTFVIMPVATFAYHKVGPVWLFLFNACTYLTAAIFETRISAVEKYVAEKAQETAKKTKKLLVQFRADFKEGIAFLLENKGLLAITGYFVVTSMSGSAENVLCLPFFKSSFTNGEYWYMLIMGAATVGRMIGGVLHYKLTFPTDKKYSIALTVYIVLNTLSAVYLYTRIPIMAVCMFCEGILGVTSYNIRISATQSYVEDGKKGRFNGIFNTLCTVGTLAGQFLAGALSTVFRERTIVSGVYVLGLLSAIVLIGGSRKSVSEIYNTQA